VPTDKVPTAVEIYPVLVRVINSTCGINRAELTPDRRVVDLAIDSVFAGEIVMQTATELGMEIDFLEILDDWSTLTLAELAAEFHRAVDDAQPGS
jgi:acyl carrier protein